MRWRRVPPVFSPISPTSILAAGSAALGLTHPDIAALTANISRTFDAHEIILTDSGTSALTLALRAVAPRGGVVGLPGYACIDLIAAVIRAGVRVSLYDLDPETLSPDLDSVRKTITSGACALVVAPLYGYPADTIGIGELASASGVPLIEDAAQGAGGTLAGRRVGAFGDLTVLSFGRGKGTTGGSGGALLVRRPQGAEWAHNARAALRDTTTGARDIVALMAQWLLARPTLYIVPASIPGLKLGEMVYHPAGEPARLSSVAAAVLPTALRLDGLEVEMRRRHASRLIAANTKARRFTPVRPLEGANPGYLRLAMLDAAGNAVPAPHLGAVRGYPSTLDEHAEAQPVLVSRCRLPGAIVLRDRLFTLPTHSRVSSSDLARLEGWLD